MYSMPRRTIILLKYPSITAWPPDRRLQCEAFFNMKPCKRPGFSGLFTLLFGKLGNKGMQQLNGVVNVAFFYNARGRMKVAAGEADGHDPCAVARLLQ
jgi:hypothetical protein